MTTRIFKWLQIVCRGLSCISPFLCWVGIDKQCPYKQSLGSRYFLHSLSASRPQRMPTPSTVGTETYCATFQICAPFLSTSNHYDILSALHSLVWTTRGASRLIVLEALWTSHGPSLQAIIQTNYERIHGIKNLTC